MKEASSRRALDTHRRGSDLAADADFGDALDEKLFEWAMTFRHDRSPRFCGRAGEALRDFCFLSVVERRSLHPPASTTLYTVHMPAAPPRKKNTISINGMVPSQLVQEPADPAPDQADPPPTPPRASSPIRPTRVARPSRCPSSPRCSRTCSFRRRKRASRSLSGDGRISLGHWPAATLLQPLQPPAATARAT